MRLRTYIWSLVISVVLTLLVGAIASLPRCSAIGVLLLPGALLAAIMLPQGVNSNAGNAYLVLAGLLDSIIVSFLVMGFWKLIERRKKAKVERI